MLTVFLFIVQQVLQQRLDLATKSKMSFNKKVEKAKEDIEDLRFQLEEKTIELEGTRAQLRVLESKSNFSPEHTRSTALLSPSRESTLRLQSVSTPSMKAMVPLAMDEILQNSSSTESAQDQTERDQNKNNCPETPKRKPSKIPLAGTKAYSAPKPPTGRSSYISNRSPSGPSSNKSLNKSLLTKSESSLIKKESPSLNRPDSAQSWRKDSLGNNKSSSIPVSAKTSPTTKSTYSPVPKTKRDSLTSRVRNLDSLSRIQNSAVSSATGGNGGGYTTTTTTSTTNLYKSNSKKDLSSSFSTGQIRSEQQRKTTTVPIRRVSSASVSRGTDLQQTTETDNGKVRTLRSSFWNWLKI